MRVPAWDGAAARGTTTIGDTVRYPDALVTCTKVPGDARLVPGVVAVFDVLSSASGRTDRIARLREYGAVPSIRRYVIVEHAGIGLTVLTRPLARPLARPGPEEDWTATALTAEDTLRRPEIGVELPVAALYDGVDLPPGIDAVPSA